MNGSRPAWIMAIVVALAGCSASVGTAPPGNELTTGIGIANGTALAVTLVVNGTTIRTFPPESGTGSDGIPAGDLPALPWMVEARSSSGRILVSMTVNAGDVSQTTSPDGTVTQRGDGVRADLSCGRLEVWSGSPMMGPPPAPGTPGDCEP